MHGREGQARIRLKDNHVASDCAYPAITRLPNGEFLVITYGHWTPGESPYILGVRLSLEDIDAKLAAMRR